MIAIAAAMLRSFLADRVAVVLSLVAPVAFFTLVGLFYRHLESDGGLRIGIALVDACGSEDSARFLAELERSIAPPLRRVPGGAEGAAAAEITLLAGFTAGRPAVRIRSEVPLPGSGPALRQLVELAAARAFADGVPEPEIELVDRPGRLVRDAVAGICLVFAMFSVASIAARGLADDAAGLSARLRSLGVGPSTYMSARILAMGTIAWAQLAVTFAWAWLAFGIRPEAPLALGVATALSACAVSAFFAAVAAICGTRTRFAAIAPVVTLVLSAFSGSLIPRFVLPAGIAGIGDALFPAWGIDACRRAIDGEWDGAALGGLLAAAVAGTVVAMRWPERNPSA